MDEDSAIDPQHHFIVCANVLGSCYGTTGSLSIDPKTSEPYYHSFPLITIRDMVRAHLLLDEHLGIRRIQTLIGGSLGGQQALEWAIIAPLRIEQLVLIATNAKHSAWGIAFNETQRMCNETDPTWNVRTPEAGLTGMKAARAAALLSYRNYMTYERDQSERGRHPFCEEKQQKNKIGS